MWCPCYVSRCGVGARPHRHAPSRLQAKYTKLHEKDKLRYDREMEEYDGSCYIGNQMSFEMAPLPPPKKVKDPNAPKRALGAYMYFVLVRPPPAPSPWHGYCAPPDVQAGACAPLWAGLSARPRARRRAAHAVGGRR